jgi:hypothetical protein
VVDARRLDLGVPRIKESLMTIITDNRARNLRVKLLLELNTDFCELAKLDLDVTMQLALLVAAGEVAAEVFGLAPLGELVEELSW